MKALQRGDKAAIVCCSNGQKEEYRERLEKLGDALKGVGLMPVFGECVYQREGVFSGTGRERAKSLMDFYRDQDIKVIFDISGGDIANEILPYLDYDEIAGQDKFFWGYSDLTTVINAIYTKTGRPSVLYQVRNLIYEDAGKQICDFVHTVMEGQEDLFTFPYEFIQGNRMEGIVIGGNIRCLLKLAGTEFWPDMKGKILLLEAYSGEVPQMVTYLSQLKQLGVFDQVNGILLGTFTGMEEGHCEPSMTELIREYVKIEIPIAQTRYIGHGVDSKGIIIGEKYVFCVEGSR